jgi:hypothetical protein
MQNTCCPETREGSLKTYSPDEQPKTQVFVPVKVTLAPEIYSTLLYRGHVFVHCLELSESAEEATKTYVARLVWTSVSVANPVMLTVERLATAGGH